MADTKAPDLKAEATQSKFEANRVQQTMQKAEAQRASDYDTGDHLALRQDILNPNLHYGLANEDEMLLPLTQSGDVQSGAADTGSGPAVTGDGSSFPSTSDGTLSSPSASSGPSAPEEIAFVAPESQRLSINNAPTGTSLSQPDLGGEEPLTIATAASKPIDGGSASGGSMPPAEDATQDVNHDVEAIDSRESVTEGSVLDSAVTATDLDGDSITYSLDGQPSEGSVSLNADGSYSFTPGADFDDLAVGESRTVSFSFTADDGHGSTDQGTVTIEVTGTNDAPTAIDLSASTVDENAAGAVIGTLSTTDVDVSDSHSYTVSDDRFEVVEDGSGNMVLQLKDGESLDHESEATVTVTVTSTDNNGASVAEDFTISVNDLNEAVTADDASETTAENVTLDSRVTATDLDGDSITYSLDGQPSEGSVSLNADGSYSFTPGADFDDLAVGESRTVSFSFTADDGNGSTDQGTVTIEVTGTNDAPTAIDLSASTVDENAVGAVIGTLSTTDVDTSDSHSYTVSDDRFEVAEDGSGNMVLQLKDGVALDHESEATVTVTVTSDDTNGASVAEDFTITVNDLNEAVTADDASETTVEGSVLDSSVTATDLDGDSITYSLDGQPSEGSVSLNADGSYSFNPGSDFDDLAVGESRTVSFSFTADDGHGSTDQGTVTIEVTGTNDAPTAIDLSASTVDENAAGAVIGTLSTTDVDVSDSHSYTVSDDRFEVVEDGSGNMVLQLKDGVALDHEAEATVTVTVTSTDTNGASVAEDFTVTVNDLNEAVTADDASETTAENATLDSSVTATDLDGDSITYSLDDQPSEGSVSLNADGSYSFTPGSDFDDLAVGESRTVSFSFTADDGRGSTDQGTVTIEVTGTNDAPTAVILSDSLVDENDAGAVIGTLTTTDVDTSDTHSYTVSDNRFEVVEDGSGNMVLQLKDGVSLDHESEPTVTVTVTSTDTNGASVAEDFTISVNDLNEAVTADDASETTAENVTLDSSVTATDLDGDSITYSLDGQPSEGAVSLNADGSYSFNPGSDFDDLAVGESRTVSFSFTADDGNGSTDQGTVTIEVTGTNDAPTAIDLSASTVDENAAGAVIGTLSTTDVDVSDSHSYSVSDDRFEVVEDGSGNMVLQLKDGVALDHESEATVTVTVSTNDGNGGTFDQDFTISVSDLNEAVTADDASETTAENVTLDSSVTATDLDGDTITYSLDGQPSEGAVSLNADGSYSFNPGSDFDDLAVGESRTVSFSFTADDGRGSTDQGTVTIEVTGTNDAPTAVILSDSLVDENDAGAVIGTLTTTDVDTSDTHSYTVSDNRFEVVEDGSGNMVLQLKDGVSLDHESEPTVTVTVTSTDTNGASVAEDFTISVNDLNEAVTADDASETTAENVTLDSSVTATDLDGDSITYSLDGQPSEGAVSLNADGSYSFNPGSDFDDLAVGESRTVSFSFTADDGNGSTDQGTVTIEVTGTNDAPTAIDLSASTVDENAAGAVIGTLSTTDVDVSDSHSYSVSDDRFEVVEDGSGNMVLQLRDGVALDHESEATVTVTVTSDDGHGGTVDQNFTIDVADVNEQITAYDSTMAISEDVISVDSAMFAEDPDGDPGIFTILTQPSSGTVTTTGEVSEFGSYTLGKFNFVPGDDFNDLAEGETRTVSFDYQVEDGNGSVDTGTVSIQVTGTNDAPTAVILSDSLVDENDAGAVIGTLSTTDADTSDTHSYTVSDDRFEVAEDGSGNMVLQLKDGVALDHESEPTVTVTVTSDDGHGGTVDQDFTINVADVNEQITAYDSAMGISEDVISVDSAMFAEDPDGDPGIFTILTQPSSGTVTTTGEVSEFGAYTLGKFNFVPGDDFNDLAEGETRTVSFDYQVEDGNGSVDTGTVSIQVTGTNDAPTAVILSDSLVDENDAGAVIGTLSTTDVDTSDTHSYTVSDDRFEVVEDGSGNMVLQLKDGVSLDYESEPTVTITITTDDGHGGSYSDDFTINVSNIMEGVTASDEDGTTTEDDVLNSVAHASSAEGANMTYVVSSQPSEGSVVMQPDGSYTFNPENDFQDLAHDESRTVSFEYTATDANGATDTGTVTILVTGTNDAPTAIDLSASTVDENATGAVIGTLSTTDVDTSDSHSYTVSDDRFEVVEDGSGNMVLQLKDGVALDHESEATVNIAVTTTDNGGLSHSQSFTIAVNDLNESPSLDASGSYNFLYNGSFEVFNGGVHGGGDGTGWYEDAYIDGWAQSDIDIHEAGHRNLGATDGAYHVDLAETSNGTLSREMEGLEDGSTYSLSIDLKSRGATGDGISGTVEDALGQSIVQVVWNGEVIATIDPAVDGFGWHTYTLGLTAGSGDGSNSITFVEVGSENSFGTLIDNVQITDSDGYGVLENEAGAEIAVLSVADPDAGDSFSYSVSDSRFEVVSIDGDTVLKLVDGVSLDYETASHVSVDVTVTDSGGLSDTQTLDIQVGDIDDTASYNTITGNNCCNTLNGTSVDDNISGLGGNDTINAYAGDDLVYGGTGADTINGGDGNDDIYGGADNDTISGGEGNDFINGEDGADTIYGNAGLDSLHGEAGDDRIYGGDGGDTIYGGEDNDSLYGEAGNDGIYGGSGNDYISGGTGDDYLVGGEGDDTFYYLVGDGNDVIDGGSAGDWTDSLVILASDGSDTTSYGTDWTITLTTGTATMVDGSDQMVLSNDATGTIDFSDGGHIELENIDRVSW